MKRFIPFVIALAFWLAAPPARSAGGAFKIITAYAGTPTAPFSSSVYDLTGVGEARAKIVSASTSAATVIVEHRTDPNDGWSTGFTCTNPDSAGECTEGLGYVDLSKTKQFRVTVSAWVNGTITVWLETVPK